MLLRIAVAASLLAAWPMAARAGAGTEKRTPTSSSIPCRGQLGEHYTQGANAFGFLYDLSLTCEEAGKVAWTLRSSVSCRSDKGLPEEGEKRDDCSGPASNPVGSFVDDQPDGRVHAYELTRYVFARNCDPVSYHRKSVQANTGVLRFEEQESGLVCKDVALVDGTTDKDGRALKPDAFKYASVKTEGGDWETEDEDPSPRVFGTTGSDSDYSVVWSKGVARRAE